MRRQVISFVPGPRAIALAAAASLLVLALTARTVRAQVLVGVAPSEISAGSGETVTIPIVVDMSGGGGASLGAYRVRLSWDPALLEYHGTTSGTFAGVGSSDPMSEIVNHLAYFVKSLA